MVAVALTTGARASATSVVVSTTGAHASATALVVITTVVVARAPALVVRAPRVVVRVPTPHIHGSNSHWHAKNAGGRWREAGRRIGGLGVRGSRLWANHAPAIHERGSTKAPSPSTRRKANGVACAGRSAKPSGPAESSKVNAFARSRIPGDETLAKPIFGLACLFLVTS